MDLSRPLSDDEFRELDAFLRSEGLPDACLDLSALDGFLTAIAVGPAPVAPAQWLPEVWGETAGQAMPWQSERQLERITGLVLRHLNDILWQLAEDPEHYEPVLYEVEREDGGGKKFKKCCGNPTDPS